MVADGRTREGSTSIIGGGSATRLVLAALLALAAALALAWAPDPALAQEDPRTEKDLAAEKALAADTAAALDCSDFATRRGAQAIFKASEGDPLKLDKDGDGTACEATSDEAAEDGTKLGAKTGGDLDCVDLPSQKAAQDRLRADPSDRHKMDPENNGVACEFAPVVYADAATDYVPVAAARSKADLDCKDFEYQQEAQMVYFRDESDPHGLDGPNEKAEKDKSSVGNGFACETTPLLMSNVEYVVGAEGAKAEGAKAAAPAVALVAAWPHGGGLGLVLDLVALLLVASGVSALLVVRRARRPSGGSGQ